MGKMVEVKFPITKLNVGKISYDEKADVLITNFSISCPAHPREAAKITHLQSQKLPLFVIFQCPQSEMDIDTVEFAATDTNGDKKPTENKEGKGDLVKEIKDNLNSLAAGLTKGTESKKDSETPSANQTGESSAGENPPAEEKPPEHNEPILALETYDMRPGEGTAIPPALYLLGQKVEVLRDKKKDNDFKAALLMLFAKLGTVCKTPAELLGVLQKYPDCDQKSQIIEMLKVEEKPKRTRRQSGGSHNQE